jgi:hypothetical protein
MEGGREDEREGGTNDHEGESRHSIEGLSLLCWREGRTKEIERKNDHERRVLDGATWQLTRSAIVKERNGGTERGGEDG